MSRPRFVLDTDTPQSGQAARRSPFPRRDGAVARRHARRTNQTVIGFAKELDTPPDRVWDLSCECGDDACFEKVCITIGEFHSHCGARTYVVAPGHDAGASVVATAPAYTVVTL